MLARYKTEVSCQKPLRRGGFYLHCPYQGQALDRRCAIKLSRCRSSPIKSKRVSEKNVCHSCHFKYSWLVPGLWISSGHLSIVQK